MGLVDSLTIAFCCVSSLLCVYGLLMLFTRFSQARTKIFWKQMVTLCLANLIMFSVRGVVEVLLFVQPQAQFHPVLPLILNWLELSGSFIEAHISVAFAVAWLPTSRTSYWLPRSLAFCFVLSLLVSFAGGCYEPGSNGIAPESCWKAWAITVFTSLGVALMSCVVAAKLAMRAADGLTIVHAERRQGFELVRQQALLRAKVYLASYLFTYGPKGAQIFFFVDHEVFVLNLLGSMCFLNVAVNVFLMMFWNSKARRMNLDESDFEPGLARVLHHFELSHGEVGDEVSLNPHSRREWLASY